jgi:hypothetical protein
MKSNGDHNRLISRAAKDVLAPLGCRQKGRSRLWFDDQGWWVGVIEFQPSSWGKGSYLNVGAMWLWNAKSHWSFDDGYRVGDYKSFGNEGQFSRAARELAERASDEIRTLRQRFASIDTAADYLGGKPKVTLWDYYHEAMICLMAGRLANAALAFERVATAPDPPVWAASLQQLADRFASLVAGGSAKAARQAVHDEITRARELLKLPSRIEEA